MGIQNEETRVSTCILNAFGPDGAPDHIYALSTGFKGTPYGSGNYYPLGLFKLSMTYCGLYVSNFVFGENGRIEVRIEDWGVGGVKTTAYLYTALNQYIDELVAYEVFPWWEYDNVAFPAMVGGSLILFGNLLAGGEGNLQYYADLLQLSVDGQLFGDAIAASDEDKTFRFASHIDGTNVKIKVS